jgi:hypothetical protein
VTAGNSVKAQKAIADISNALGGNPPASKPRQCRALEPGHGRQLSWRLTKS